MGAGVTSTLLCWPGFWYMHFASSLFDFNSLMLLFPSVCLEFDTGIHAPGISSDELPMDRMGVWV